MWKWDNKYSVGVDYIDNQHMLIVRYINEVEALHESIQNGNQVAKEEILTILGKLLDYTKTHFHDEEVLLKRANYRGYDKHVEIHQHLVANVEMLKEKFNESGNAILPIMSEFLTKWLKTHIAQVDQKYSPYLSKRSTP